MQRKSWRDAMTLLFASLLLVTGQMAQADERDEKVTGLEDKTVDEQKVDELDVAPADELQRGKQKLREGAKSAKGAKKAAKHEQKSAKDRREADAEKAQKGGQALEHRSEHAAERANSQWEGEAIRGHERAGSVRDAVDRAGNIEGEALDDGADVSARKAQAADRRGKGESPTQAKGFWKRSREILGLDDTKAEPSNDSVEVE
ncbi:MAG: hypothetical protein OEY15_02235 [Myxococcales bacterium]|nr:hypothetical protein [Myxococcales bacterium]